jgi:hypothetical protein
MLKIKEQTLENDWKVATVGRSRRWRCIQHSFATPQRRKPGQPLPRG